MAVKVEQVQETVAKAIVVNSRRVDKIGLADKIEPFSDDDSDVSTMSISGEIPNIEEMKDKQVHFTFSGWFYCWSVAC